MKIDLTMIDVASLKNGILFGSLFSPLTHGLDVLAKLSRALLGKFGTLPNIPRS